jgi:hypothetical protein
MTFNERDQILTSDGFFRGYLETALWSSENNADEPLARSHGFRDFALTTFQQMLVDCTRFQEENGHLIIDDNCHYRGCPVEEYAGHAFWMTRNRNSCGFWDNDWEKEAGNQLTQATMKFPKVCLYIGGDGRIYAR